MQSLGNDKLASCEIAQLNKAKNRFANIFPCEYLICIPAMPDGFGWPQWTLADWPCHAQMDPSGGPCHAQMDPNWLALPRPDGP